MAEKTIQVTLIKSMSGRGRKHIACVHGLGLRRLHHSVMVEDTSSVRGMINKIPHLLRVEEK
jgi:large subunit ribosomal protein L30